MLKKDFLEKQLEQLGIVIARLIEKITQQRTGNNLEEIQNNVDECLRSEFNLRLDIILALKEEEFIPMLSEQQQLTAGHLGLLADLMIAMEKQYEASGNPVFAKNLIKKNILLLEHVTRLDKTFSADRQEKLNTLKSKL